MSPRKTSQNCKHFLENKCLLGINCFYLHEKIKPIEVIIKVENNSNKSKTIEIARNDSNQNYKMTFTQNRPIHVIEKEQTTKKNNYKRGRISNKIRSCEREPNFKFSNYENINLKNKKQGLLSELKYQHCLHNQFKVKKNYVKRLNRILSIDKLTNMDRIRLTLSKQIFNKNIKYPKKKFLTSKRKLSLIENKDTYNNQKNDLKFELTEFVSSDESISDETVSDSLNDFSNNLSLNDSSDNSFY